MQTQATLLPELTAWQRDARRRRAGSMAMAALAISAFILLVEFSSEPESLPEIEVFVLPAQSEPVVEEEKPPPVVEPVEERPIIDESVEQVAVVEPPPEEQPDTRRDWYAQMEVIARSVITEQQKTYSLNPALDEKRRQAAERFRPSRAPVKKPIWENVETDQMGRKILVSGDCHRVVDDPSAVRAYDFRTFHQYITFCSKSKKPPQELPWVEEIRQRYVYLQPDQAENETRVDILAGLR